MSEENRIPGWPKPGDKGWQGLQKPDEPPVTTTEVNTDHSVPYPDAPDVDHADEGQEHYRGARDPELATPPYVRGRQ